MNTATPLYTKFSSQTGAGGRLATYTVCTALPELVIKRWPRL
jgi:hypothetical protein